ncbi:MAG: aminotransferase [Salinibacterium sp.]|nr:aminotransferase [Salinibacterium sp.]
MVQVPPPEISTLKAESVALELSGVPASARSLGSHQDRNFLLTAAEGPLLLKFSNPGTTGDELAAQNAAVDYLAGRVDVRVPRARAGVGGLFVQVARISGVDVSVRLLTFVEGQPLSGGQYLSPAVITSMGAMAAQVDVALAGLSVPALDRPHQWDLRVAAEVLTALLPFVTDDALRQELQARAHDAIAVVDATADDLPLQLIHGDLTDDNVVAMPAIIGLPDGVIDFGDIGMSWAVSELAITVSSLLHHEGGSLVAAMRAVSAYHAARPLSRAEAEALWPLVVVRGAVLVASGYHVASSDSGNDYATANLAHELLIFERATVVPLGVARALVLDTLGFAREIPGLPAHGRLLPGIDPGSVATLDLSATSPLLDGGRWLDDDAESSIIAESLTGSSAVITRFAEARLTRSEIHSPGESATVVLGIEVSLPEPREVVAPWGGILATTTTGVSLHGHGVVLTLEGVTSTREAGIRVDAGEALGLTGGVLRISVSVDGVEVPWAVAPSLARAWGAASIDPTSLIVGGGVAPAPAPDPQLLERRERYLAGAQEHYYCEPPVMVRGYQQHLIDEDARVYLDGLNNVTSIGHSHPRLVTALTRQWSLLNTNSRFNYPAVVDFAERLANLLPAPLDSVFFVNSGSEAVDLALRIGRAWTGRRDVLAVREAYHGWTDLSDSVSTSIADNPDALTTRPSWVHTVEAPNSYRGRYRDGEADRYAQDAVSRIEALATAGTPIGAFVAEAYYGNAGGMALPDGYLKAVYDAVRSHGGLCVADEVQVGYGRLGDWFWGFEQQAVVPDIVAVAKAMGNGHPLGAVITTREIAEHYRSEGYFFSSAGGSPVSSVIGMTVLDVIRDEELQRNARDTGAYLKARLEELGTRHPLVGAVHGTGLYLGLEFVRDRATLEPAPEETLAICERLRELGIIMQPTSDRQCVLKIKPPLCLTRSSADFFVDSLDHVLTTGW